MENKKQLIIIPPMSEPLQKLNEVLNGIAAEENIEISVVDDLKELMQFVGSSGQCLIAFSNAKKCATFLQENRLIIARSHSKVILLTPKEIPPKTLTKFTKIGLTESILESSPPKTLLYKVKLLLRSIKSTGNTEEKELAVRSIDAVAKDTQAKGEINSDKLQSEESSVNYLAEERAKFKKASEDESDSVNYMDNLKGNTTAQEESIETHWKSKRKKSENPLEEEVDYSKVETEESADIDMYYRGKKKTNEMDLLEAEDPKSRKKSDHLEEEPDNANAKSNSFELDLVPAEVEKRNKREEEEAEDYLLKRSKEIEPPEEAEEEPSNQLLSEEDEEERKKKMLLELDALFEEAKKRQQLQEAEDLGGHYKGKISKNRPEEEAPEETQEREEYDNSDLYSKDSSLDLNLAPSEEEKHRGMQEDEEEDEEKERNGFGEKIGGNLESEEGQTDHIETLMKSDISQDNSNNIKTVDIQERTRIKEEEEELSEDKNSLDLTLDPKSSDSDKKMKEQLPEDEAEEKEKSIDLDLAPGSDVFGKKKKLLNEEATDQEREALTKLKLIDGQKESNRKSEKEEEDTLGFRKLDAPNLQPEQKRDRENHGPVDKIDTFYRGGDAKKKEHDWDLDERKNKIDLGLEKKTRRAADETLKKESIDLGEQTIDYRKMKEEFDAIARGGDIGDEGLGAGPSERKNGEEGEDGSFKVVELEAAGFDFAIEILNMIYQKELKPDEFFRAISEEMQKVYNAFPVFYSFKPSDKKHIEIFDSIIKVATSDDIRMWWMDHKKDETIWAQIQSKTMATWVCREINWEDVELPTWASNELTNKKVEYIYPYFDGVDRMGLAAVYFPGGIKPAQARGIEVTLELARTLLLDTIQRKTNSPGGDEGEPADTLEPNDKKNILSVFSGFFKGKKAG